MSQLYMISKSTKFSFQLAESVFSFHSVKRQASFYALSQLQTCSPRSRTLSKVISEQQELSLERMSVGFTETV